MNHQLEISGLTEKKKRQKKKTIHFSGVETRHQPQENFAINTLAQLCMSEN